MSHDRIVRFGHTELSTWGLGKEYSDYEWTSFIRQLIHRGYLIQDIANYSVLKLTPKAREVLSGGVEVELAKPRIIERASKKKKKKRKSTAVVADLNEQDQALFSMLRQVRTQIAQAQGVPPYMVFGDKTLKQMAQDKPTNSSQFLDLNGVGESKLEKYGDIFLEALSGFELGA